MRKTQRKRKVEVYAIGLGCRFPESAGPAEFWTNLLSGRDMVTTDARRWPVGLHGLPQRNGKIAEIDMFDAEFFRIHGRQAQALDPQLRQLLEVSLEAFVDSGIEIATLAGSNTGVYVGSCTTEAIQAWNQDFERLSGYENVGTAQSMFANRLSFTYDFRGPSKNIDTACSSSLVALHDAVRDLRSGVCRYAVVAGSNLLMDPARSLGFQRLKMLSADGTCRSFDAQAKGYVRSEGIGVVILTSDPQQAERAYARILGSGVNNDGYTEEGITFPSAEAQAQLIASVGADAGIAPEQVDFLEAHGTGTVAGDAQELRAVEKTYGVDRSAAAPLWIGSIKSNIGHCEGASGIAGLIKMLLAYNHKQLPGNLHYQAPNPSSVPLADGRLQVLTETRDWPGGIAALSSFGFGGTNAHVLLGSPPQQRVLTRAADTVQIEARKEAARRPLIGGTVQWKRQRFTLPTYRDFLRDGPHPDGEGAALKANHEAAELDLFTYTYDLLVEDAYILDHVIDGRILAPATLYIYSVWRALADRERTTLDTTPLRLRNIEMTQAVQIPENAKTLTLTVGLDKQHGFRVLRHGETIALGRVDAQIASLPDIRVRDPLVAYHRYPHGYVAISMLLAGRPMLESMRTEGLSCAALTARHHCNPGYLAVFLRTMTTLGWVEQTATAYRWNSDHPFYPAAVDPDLADFLNEEKLETALRGGDISCINLRRISRMVSCRWPELQDFGETEALEELRDFLDGFVLVACLGALRRILGYESANLPGDEEPSLLSMAALHPRSRAALFEVLTSRGWGSASSSLVDTFELSRRGAYLWRQSTSYLTLSSYHSMFAQLPQLLSGDAAAVFHRRADGSEGHIDRRANVVGSGFQHRAYFSDMTRELLGRFNDDALAQQPRCIVDMGCGDGSLLLSLHRAIRQTARGRAMQKGRHPLLFIGVDFNAAARSEAAETLAAAKVPHKIVAGDINDPAALGRELAELGFSHNDVLHIRSFLDHDRPWLAVDETAEIVERHSSALDHHAVHVHLDGTQISGDIMQHALVQHFRRWAEIIGHHGLSLLEVFCGDRATAHPRDEGPSFHFDAYQSLSHQWLVPPTLFFRAAAEAGLFPSTEGLRLYPRGSRANRIVLSHLRKKPYRICAALPRKGDLAAVVRTLLALDSRCRPAPMRCRAEDIAEILGHHPQWCFVARGEDGNVLGSVLARPSPLKPRPRRTENFARDTGSASREALQLLGIWVDPTRAPEALSEALLGFFLLQADLSSKVHYVTGVSRCSAWPQQRANFSSFRQYALSTTARDPGLGLHLRQGAAVVDVLPDYWPADVDNDGYGVAIQYTLTRPEPDTAKSIRPWPIAATIPAMVDNALVAILGGSPAEQTAWRDAGVDSLELMDLRARLQDGLPAPLPADLLLDNGNAGTLKKFLQQWVEQHAAKTTVATTSGNETPAPQDTPDIIEHADFYLQLKRRGYQYGPEFRTVERLRTDHAQMHLTWRGRWVAFLDGLLQSCALAGFPAQNDLRIPTAIRFLEIAPEAMVQSIENPGDEVVADIDLRSGTVRCPGITIEGLQTAVRKRATDHRAPLLFTSVVVPFGEIVVDDEKRERYLAAVYAFAAERLAAYLPKYTADHPHLGRLAALLRGCPPAAPVPDSEIARLMQEPDAILLRMCRDLLADEDRFRRTLADPIRATTQHPEHGELYRRDLHASGFGRQPLDDALALVEENCAEPMAICEVGSGTGGLTRQIFARAAFGRTGRYVATDVTSFFAADLRRAMAEEFGAGNIEQGLWDINQPIDAGLGGPFDLIIASNAIHTCDNLSQTLGHLHNALHDNGFLCFFEATSVHSNFLWGLDASCWNFRDQRAHGLWTSIEGWRSVLDDSGFGVLQLTTSKQRSSGLFVSRKKPRRGRHVYVDLGRRPEQRADALRTLRQQGGNDSVEIQSHSMAAIGLVRCLRREPGGARFHARVDATGPAAPRTNAALALKPALAVKAEGRWGSLRQRPFSLPQATPEQCAAYAKIHWSREETALTWYPLGNPRSDEQRCRVHSVGLNFRDVMLATGRLDKEAIDQPGYIEDGEQGFAIEFSGIRSDDGARVMGVAVNALGTHVNARTDLVWHIPTAWSFAEAATVPIVYATIYYALVVRARLRPGQSVLVHSGAGGLGLAAIDFCLGRGCTVFTTCGTARKKALLLEKFPDLKPEWIGSSRHHGFESMVKEGTRGRGVDIVLNSLSGELLQESLRCVAPFGHFLELGKVDMLQGSALSMAHLFRNTTFHGIDLTQALEQEELWRQVWGHVDDGVRSGEVRPIAFTEFRADELGLAIDTMSRGQHSGKLVIDAQSDKQERSVSPEFVATPGRTYLLSGGLGGFGLELARWLAQRGAKRIVLTSRTGVRHGRQAMMLHYLRHSLGVEVVVSTLDICVASEAEELIDFCNRPHAPLAGIFHLAMVLRDKLFDNLSDDDMEAVIAPKVLGCLHLDRYSRAAQSLEHFVAFSSVAALFGNAGQSNYGLANAEMESLCADRREAGHRALCIRWGPIAEVGFVAEAEEVKLGKALERLGRLPIATCLTTLGALMVGRINRTISVFEPPVEIAVGGKAENQPAVSVVQGVLNILGMHQPPAAGTPLRDLGIDSLQVVEVQSLLHQHGGSSLPVAEIQNLSLQDLEALDTPDRVPQATTSTAEVRHPTHAGPLIERARPSAALHHRIIYFLGGLGTEPTELTALAELDQGCAVYWLHWERGASLHAMREVLESHISRQRPAADLEIWGHSAGGLIGQWLRSHSPRLQRRIKSWVALCPATERVFVHMQNLTGLEGLAADELANRWRHLPFLAHVDPGAVEGRTAALLHQSLTLHQAYPQPSPEHIRCDLVVLAHDDNVTVSAEQAQTIGRHVLYVEGQHDPATLSPAAWRQVAKASMRRRAQRRAKTKTAVVFPGQGAQFVGMGREVFTHFPEQAQMASQALGYDIQVLCLRDPEGVLHQTQYTQPALFVVNALEYLAYQEEHEAPDYFAGHSLGEYNALHAAGVFDFATGLRLVRRRGEIMQQVGDGGMAAVIGLDHAALQDALIGEDLLSLDIANLNSATQVVLAGPEIDIDRAVLRLSNGRVRCIKLNASGAFHSRYMRPMVRTYRRFLDELAAQCPWAAPAVPVLANTSGKIHRKNVRPALAKQLAAPVLWDASMRWLRDHAVEAIEEIGPRLLVSHFDD